MASLCASVAASSCVRASSSVWPGPPLPRLGRTKAWHHALALFFSMAMARTKLALPYAQGLQK
jgi:hypothetical protein